MSYHPYNDEIQLQFMDNLRENMTNDIFQTIVASIDEIIDLKLDDDLRELDDEHMVKLRQ